MRSYLALVALASLDVLAACEQGLPDPVAPSAPAPAEHEPSRDIPAPAIAPSVEQELPELEPAERKPAELTFEQLTGGQQVPKGFPAPPSMEPKAYAAWLKGLPAVDRVRIARHCQRHTTDFQTVCGGIGPLHIPYPPMPRARMKGEHDLHSLYASYEDWHGVLTHSQLKYIDTHCVGGEMMPSSDLCGDNTPLVISFGEQPVVFAPTSASFAFAAGHPAATDWPTAATPWLALDRDGDGAITSGAELFGNNAPSGDGVALAANGFVALAALDANRDGVIDARDASFGKLLLWADANGDHRSSPDELRAASEVVDSIALANHLDVRCDARGNCEGERAAVGWHDNDGAHHGAVVDVYLPSR